MSYEDKLQGLYIITDDHLIPDKQLYEKVEESLKSGATIVQLRDKNSDEKTLIKKSLFLQELCEKYDALFVLNDKSKLAIDLKYTGLHIGKSDYKNFDEIRKKFKGIIGVSCYDDIEKALELEKRGADYVAFGSFFKSPTKPQSKVIPLEVLKEAKEKLNIPICAIGGINSENISDIMAYEPNMVSVISDIWTSKDVGAKSEFYKKQFTKSSQ